MSSRWIEILVTTEAASAAGLETGGLEKRTLTLRGRDELIDAWVTTGVRAVV